MQTNSWCKAYPTSEPGVYALLHVAAGVVAIVKPGTGRETFSEFEQLAIQVYTDEEILDFFRSNLPPLPITAMSKIEPIFYMLAKVGLAPISFDERDGETLAGRGDPWNTFDILIWDKPTKIVVRVWTGCAAVIRDPQGVCDAYDMVDDAVNLVPDILHAMIPLDQRDEYIPE